MKKRTHNLTAYRLWPMIAVIVFLAGAVLSLSAPPARAQQGNPVDTVRVIGSSRIHANEPSAARDDAVSAGLIEAVSRVLGEKVAPDIMTGHFQVLNEKIYNHTDRFINEYQVLAESKMGKNYLVLVQAAVASDRLQATLDSLGLDVAQKKSARVLFCVAEKLADDITYTYWWGGDRTETSSKRSLAVEAAGQRLAEAGFTVVKPDSSSGLSGNPAELSVSEAAAIGQRMQADVVIVGTAVVEENPGDTAGSTRSLRATIQMNAYRSDNGNLVAQSRQTEISAPQDQYGNGWQPLAQAASRAGEELAGQISQAMSGAAAGKSTIEVVVAGTGGNIADFVKLRGALSTMSGVGSVQLKEMRQDAAVLNVDYQGNAQALANALQVQKFDYFAIEISQVGLNIITMQLVRQ